MSWSETVVVCLQDLTATLTRRQNNAFSCSFVTTQTGAVTVVAKGLARSVASLLARLVALVVPRPPARDVLLANW
jgi:hypothetical protein